MYNQVHFQITRIYTVHYNIIILVFQPPNAYNVTPARDLFQLEGQTQYFHDIFLQEPEISVTFVDLIGVNTTFTHRIDILGHNCR